MLDKGKQRTSVGSEASELVNRAEDRNVVLLTHQEILQTVPANQSRVSEERLLNEGKSK